MRLSCALAFALLGVASLLSAAKPVPGPVQKIEGPGGKNYHHQGFISWQHGKQENRYQVFEPANPQVEKAGLVILLHDWFAADPEYYTGLIRHLCQNGRVVLFPHYQGVSTPDKDWHINIAWAAKDFLIQMFNRGKTTINREEVIVIGHGAGGILAANLAATADYFGLPQPAGILILTPHQGSLKLLDLGGISRKAKLVIVSGDRIKPENDLIGREIFYAAHRVRSDNKVFVTVLSDFYGQPPLVADELAPLAPEKPEYERLIVRRRNEFVKMFRDKFTASPLRTDHIDAFDWFVVFRFFDLIADSVAQKQKNLRSFKNTPGFRFMGYWSDGKKLKGLIISDRP